MAVMEQDAPSGFDPGARNTAAGLSFVGGIAAAVITALLVFAPNAVPLGVDHAVDTISLSLLGAAAVFMILGAVIVVARLGLGGVIALIGVLFWLIGCIVFKSFSWVLFAPVVLALLGALTGMIANDRLAAKTDGRLVYRQTRLS